MSRAWTQEQKNAIDARDGTLLVSAAAPALVETAVGKLSSEMVAVNSKDSPAVTVLAVSLRETVVGATSIWR